MMMMMMWGGWVCMCVWACCPCEKKGVYLYSMSHGHSRSNSADDEVVVLANGFDDDDAAAAVVVPNATSAGVFRKRSTVDGVGGGNPIFGALGTDVR